MRKQKENDQLIKRKAPSIKTKIRTICPWTKIILRANILRKWFLEAFIQEGRIKPKVFYEHGHWGGYSAYKWSYKVTLGYANGQPTATAWCWCSRGALCVIDARGLCQPLVCQPAHGSSSAQSPSQAPFWPLRSQTLTGTWHSQWDGDEAHWQANIWCSIVPLFPLPTNPQVC